MKKNKAMIEVRFKGIGGTMLLVSGLSATLGFLLGAYLGREDALKEVNDEEKAQ